MVVSIQKKNNDVTVLNRVHSISSEVYSSDRIELVFVDYRYNVLGRINMNEISDLTIDSVKDN